MSIIYNIVFDECEWYEINSYNNKNDAEIALTAIKNNKYNKLLNYRIETYKKENNEYILIKDIE